MHFMLSHSRHPSTLLSFLSHLFKRIVSCLAKALIHLTLSKDVVLQWHSYYSTLHAPPPIPTVLREGAVLYPTCLPNALSWHGLFGFTRGWQYGNAADLMDDCLKMASCNRNRSKVWGLFLCFMFFFSLLKKAFSISSSSRKVLLYLLIPLRIKLARDAVKGGKLCHCVSKWVHITHTEVHMYTHTHR